MYVCMLKYDGRVSDSERSHEPPTPPTLATTMMAMHGGRALGGDLLSRATVW